MFSELTRVRIRLSLLDDIVQKRLWDGGKEFKAPVHFFNAMSQLKQQSDNHNGLYILQNFHQGNLCDTEPILMRTASPGTLNLLKMIAQPGSREDMFIDKYL